ncbi:MAG: CDP-diacylglycerol--glycerol-3-phosphate 3-phosphatidyltransferase [Balneolales bacterium]|nr:CDP-diacylglycerol--glycerol-3-phosphate 3-phosphatidyltransferase [Balneolales bacterium]
MKNVPNILSAVRILLTPVFIILYVQDELLYRSLAIGVFGFAAITDYFDGYIAREFNAGSNLGRFLDPLADKFLTFAGFAVLPYIDIATFHILPVVLIVLRDLFVTIMRLIANRKSYTMQTSNIAKFKTAVQMVFLPIALLGGLFVHAEIPPSEFTRWLFDSGIFTWALYAVAAFTVYTGIDYIRINKDLFVKSDENGN